MDGDVKRFQYFWKVLFVCLNTLNILYLLSTHIIILVYLDLSGPVHHPWEQASVWFAKEGVTPAVNQVFHFTTNYLFAQKHHPHHQSSPALLSNTCFFSNWPSTGLKHCIIAYLHHHHNSVFKSPQPVLRFYVWCAHPLYCASTHPKTPLMALLLPNTIPLHKQECQCKPSWWGNNALLTSPSSKSSGTSPCSAPSSPPQSPSLQSHPNSYDRLCHRQCHQKSSSRIPKIGIGMSDCLQK